MIFYFRLEEQKKMTLKDSVLLELKANSQLIEKGKDNSSSSGSDDCPSEDNLTKEELSQILPGKKKNKEGNSKLKENMRGIFGFVKKEKKQFQEDAKKKENAKEEKKAPVQKPEKKVEKVIKKTPLPEEDKKEKEEVPPVNQIKLVDASTQTEKIDFQKAQ